MKTRMAGMLVAGLLVVPIASGVEVGPLPLRENIKTRMAVPVRPAPGLVLHVAPDGGDAADGSATAPFGSLERARDEVRERRKAGSLAAGGVEVRVAGGVYPVTRTFELTSEDSGTEARPLVIRAAPGEKPVFRGGTRLQGWRKLSDADGYDLLRPEARPVVWVLDLKAAGIDGLMPLKLGGFASGNGFKTHPAHELFFNGDAMSLARGPNEGFLRVKDVAVKDGTKGYDREGSMTGRFFYDGDLPGRWVDEPDLLLYGYWFWDWADSYERVAAIDPEKRMITLAEPWHRYGFSVGAPFYAVNALSELDAAGEWYLDRSGGKLLFVAPSDPREAVVELSRFAAPMVDMRGVSRVGFEGLTWELGSADAIHVRDGSDCWFAGCVVRRFAGNGVDVQGGKRHGLRSCGVSSMGRGGVILSGGDRKTLEPSGHFLENCEIHDLSRIDHTYTPALILRGVGGRVAHNRMYDIRSSAMRVEGNDNVIEYNEIYEAVTESDDQGGADMWGNPTFRGNVYRYNYWHHIGNWPGTGEHPKCGQGGIRLDDAICGVRIHGNVFERCSTGKNGFGGVQIHGGKENVIENNLFVDCMAMVSFTPWNEARWRSTVAPALESAEIDRELYLKRYPALADLAENANRNVIRRNLGFRCGEMLRHPPGNLEVADNVMLDGKAFTWDPADFKLDHPGFERIPFEEIGLYRDGALRP